MKAEPLDRESVINWVLENGVAILGFLHLDTLYSYTEVTLIEQLLYMNCKL